MSSPDNARRAYVRVKFEGADITKNISPYLISATYTDNEEDKADDFQLQLQDRESVWQEKWLNEAIEAAVSPGQGEDREGQARPQGKRAGVWDSGGETVSLTGPLLMPDIQQGGNLSRYVWSGENRIQDAAGAAAEEAQEEKRQVSTGLTVEAEIVLENWRGGGVDIVLPCGKFELDSVAPSGPPAVILLKCTSLPYKTQLRQTKKSRAWERYTLSGIAGKIAGLYGMTLMYESGLDPFYTRVEQIKTSDIQFLETLCHNAGLALKITGNTIVLFDQADYEARAAVYTIRRGGGAYTKYKLGTGTADVQYASCRVSYTGPDGRCVSAVAWAEDYDAKARNNQQLEITAKTDSPDQARTLAEKILRRHNRYAKTASFTLPGGYSLVAGVTVRLECWGGWDGKYIVTQAKHTVDGSGYTVDVNLRKVLEGY